MANCADNQPELQETVDYSAFNDSGGSEWHRIEDWGMLVRTFNRLKKANINFAEDICHIGKDELFYRLCMDRTSFEETLSKMAESGFAFDV